MNTYNSTGGGDFPIPPDWEPDDLLIRDLRRQHGLPAAFLREQGLLFRMRAKERGYQRSNWREGFRLWVERGMRERFVEYQPFLNDEQ